MSTIGYRFNELQQLLAELRQEATAIDGLLDEEQNLMTTIAGGWTGEGKSAWEAAQSRWQADANNLNAALHNLVTVAEGQVGAVSSAEQANATSFR